MGYFYERKLIACCAMLLLSAFLLILSVLGAALGIAACASFNTGESFSGGDGEISARGAVGGLAARLVSGLCMKGTAAKIYGLRCLRRKPRARFPNTCRYTCRAC